jgi:mitochondrial FAD-linked sulfhydryl oxidase
MPSQSEEPSPSSSTALPAGYTRTPSGVVLGPDGKPCKVELKKNIYSITSILNSNSISFNQACNSGLAFKAFTQSLTPSSSNSKHKQVVSSSLYSDCPPDGDALGRQTWTFLHSVAAYFPTRPSPLDRSSFLSLVASLPILYPCKVCADHLGEYVIKDPPERAVERGREGVEQWMCRMHNEVNLRLGKESFDCSRVGERWRDGWKDGRCD